ncbi:bifunctional pyr operon transcriptional regulator/uracil phosphoribosyltransferase PyrR [Psittacicella gerlachiana]|uniref:Bifunctional protein PyrR n=1 Tax=Psittacicella gerlachiana TaxID=2028574 RepID=A0A3A1YPG5_9GAMM|nr:bifunctional pyr operon transcriptional regulator/uracil phosphoribosyltransferase PyrR [Psittacicella gerlachiana]RIY38850.1 bifunctional pyr operon transcriptional regulator/uracil phosphoribosyltransferase [Psittacicella gerlachiana]
MSERILHNPQDIKRMLTRIAHEILEKVPNLEQLVLVGIKRRGEFLAHRLQDLILKFEGVKVPLEGLDITPYRDDIDRKHQEAKQEKVFTLDLNHKTVIIVDDVLYTGRTIRSAMDAIMDAGRPDAIRLAVMVDRGHRELPIRADFVGKNIPTSHKEIINLHLEEVDGEDKITII